MTVTVNCECVSGRYARDMSDGTSGGASGTTSDGASLRERKRLAAMRRIQEVALDLFDQYGYSQVVIERIAARAEVSASSVYRYFGTKEQIVLWDEYDPMAFSRLSEELRHRPPLAAARHAVATVLAEMVTQDERRTRRRVHYMMQEPSIEAGAAVQAHQAAGLIVALLADGLGRPHDDLDIHLLSHSIVGGIMGAMRYWYQTDFGAPLDKIIDRMFSSFEHGFTLPG